MKQALLFSCLVAILNLFCTPTIWANEKTPAPDPQEKKEAKPLFAGSYAEAGLTSIKGSSPVFDEKDQNFTKFSSYKAQFNSSTYFGLNGDSLVIITDRSWVDQLNGYIYVTIPFNFSDLSAGYLGGSLGYRHTRKWSDFYGLDVQSSAPAYQGYLGIKNIIGAELRYTEFSTGTDPDGQVDDLVVVLNRQVYRRLETNISLTLPFWITPYAAYGGYNFSDATLSTPMEEFKIKQDAIQFLNIGAVIALGNLKIKVNANKVIKGAPNRENIYVLTGLRILADSYDSLGVSIALGI